MAIGNRVETQSVVTSTIVPTVTNAIHRGLLNNDILESVLFRKDVIGSETPSAGTVTVDFSDKDCATITTAVNLSISFTGLQNGDVKYIALTKGIANTVSFSGATDQTYYKNEVNTLLTYVVYQVFNKNGIIYVQAIYSPTQLVNSGFTTISSLDTGWAGTVKYRNNVISGKIEVEIDVVFGPSGGTEITTLPLAVRPDRVILNSWFSDLPLNNEKSFGINTSGEMYSIGAASNSESFYAYVEYYKTIP